MTLYLKYRPIDFESLVGQDFIKNTLKEAIKKDKLIGAYLFCGPRGTGKTSTARIFAKAINCLDLINGNPCLKCKVCEGFLENSLVDIIEIDAASNTGVDNIREIIEKAVFSPTFCKYKVYIIDEVHMLSKGAFNALLKILEEPPKHLKFILATTEKHKIPETILSRCQIYDFKSINSIDLTNRLKFIAKNENILVDEKSLEFIVKQAKGGLRNAISLFEQLIVNDEIKYDTIINNYGIPTSDIISNFYTKIINNDNSVINDFDSISNDFNLQLFFKELLFYIKDILLENLNNKEVLDKNIFILETLSKAFYDSKNSFDEKTIFLIGLLKCIELKEVKKDINKETKIKEVEEKTINTIKPKEENLTDNDLFDIFGEEESQVEDKIEEKEVKNSSFDQEKLINEVKNLGGKGALTMSLRGSSFNFDFKKLTIFTKTKMSLKQISSNDNIALITSAMEKIGFLNINIEVK
ncbi:DNA polymerase III subunit gamma/tau [Candidatus Gracilibacteria bacterium]|nr:DNA polymerase III subunit gamma/tau [Candidatus Gracilibacteria bacterium]